MFFHPIAGRWRPACLRVATASVETVSPPSELYRNTTGRSRPPMATAAQRGTVAYPGRGRPFGHASEVLPGVIPSGARPKRDELEKLKEFAAKHQGVEGYLEPRTATFDQSLLLVARGGRLVGMTPWPRPFDALAIPPARPSARRGGLKAGAGATTTRTAPGRCLELTLFDGVLIIL